MNSSGTLLVIRPARRIRLLCQMAVVALLAALTTTSTGSAQAPQVAPPRLSVDVWEGPLANGTPPVNRAAMATDHKHNNIVLFGGIVGNGPTSNPDSVSGDTWIWDGLKWEKRRPSGQSPSPRWAANMAWDGEHVIMHGGYAGGVFYSDTWLWDGSRWSETSSAGGPAVADAAIDYDPKANHVVLFGGFAQNRESGNANISTYIWTGKNHSWTQVTNPSVDDADFFERVPPPQGSNMAFDGQQMVLFGGDGRRAGYMSKDRTLQANVGGGSVAETWLWDGAGWAKVLDDTGVPNPAGPEARSDAAMVYDAARDRVVLFGGVQFYYTEAEACSDVLFNTIFPEGAGDDRLNCAPTLTGPFLFRGKRFDDTWVWSKGVWRQIPIPTRPSPRFTRAAAFDSAGLKVVLFGGSPYGFAAAETDTWSFPRYLDLPALPPTALVAVSPPDLPELPVLQAPKLPNLPSLPGGPPQPHAAPPNPPPPPGPGTAAPPGGPPPPPNLPVQPPPSLPGSPVASVSGGPASSVGFAPGAVAAPAASVGQGAAGASSSVGLAPLTAPAGSVSPSSLGVASVVPGTSWQHEEGVQAAPQQEFLMVASSAMVLLAGLAFCMVLGARRPGSFPAPGHPSPAWAAGAPSRFESS